MKDKLKAIKWNQPKYVLPILLLPTALFINWLYISFGSDDTGYQGDDLDNINIAMPEPSEQVKEDEDDKFSAFQKNFNKEKDFSAIRAFEEEEIEDNNNESVYTDEEKKYLDSINNYDERSKSLDVKLKELENYAIESNNKNNNIDKYYEDRYNEINKPLYNPYEEEEKESTNKEMDFVTQMKIIDSITNPEKYAKSKDLEELIEKKAEKDSAVFVSKNKNSNQGFFNSINKTSRNDNDIKAIIDEGVTVIQGSRVKIRLLNDIYIDDILMEKGTNLYGIVSGFSTERLQITINSVKIRDKFYPVKLAVYDNDGMKGLYVPASAFRELTKQFAGKFEQTGGQSLTLEQTANSGSQVLYSFINDLVKASTKSASSFLQSNKAKVKYNTVVYLINESN